MTKSVKKTIFVSTILGLILLFSVNIAHNHFENNRLAELATPDSSLSAGFVALTGTDIFESSEDADLKELLDKVFAWGIGLTIILAILFIIIGAVQYMTTDAVSNKKDGMQKIQAAIGGLVLALVSWLILSTINPGLLENNISIDDAAQAGVTEFEGPTTVPDPEPEEVDSYQLSPEGQALLEALRDENPLPGEPGHVPFVSQEELDAIRDAAIDAIIIDDLNTPVELGPDAVTPGGRFDLTIPGEPAQ